MAQQLTVGVPELPPGWEWHVLANYPDDVFLANPQHYAGFWQLKDGVVYARGDDKRLGQSQPGFTREEGLAYLAQLAWLGEI